MENLMLILEIRTRSFECTKTKCNIKICFEIQNDFQILKWLHPTLPRKNTISHNKWVLKLAVKSEIRDITTRIWCHSDLSGSD